MALTSWERDARNQQIAEAQNAIRSGNAAAAQAIVDNLIGGSRIGGAQAALQSAINSMPPPPPAPPTPSPPANPTPSTPSVSSPSSPTTNYPPPPPPTPPNPWIRTSTYVPPSGVRQADPDIILDPETDTSGDYIAERFFEELGGTELISISRHDLIDGINVTYNPIANLSRIRRRYNPNNIIAMDIYADNEFTKAAIDLISRGMNEPYFDDNGDLIVEIDIIRPEENIEAQISQQGTTTRIEI